MTIIKDSDPVDHAGWSDVLYAAWTTRTPIEPLTDQVPHLTIDDAYQIQHGLAALLLGRGGKVVGYKLGLTSKPMQEMLGVDEPDYGPLLSPMVFDDGSSVDLSARIHAKVEAEIALVLDRPLQGPHVTVLDAAQAIGGAVAAIELVDSRIRDWNIGLLDTISDLASSAATIVGSRLVPIEGWDPRLVGMIISRNGQIVATGAGAASMGNPVQAVAWLANTLAGHGESLQAGHLIMTGALHAAFDVAPGDLIRAEFDRLGTVQVRMV